MICGNCNRFFDVSVVEAAVAVEYAVVDLLSVLLLATGSQYNILVDGRLADSCWILVVMLLRCTLLPIVPLVSGFR